MATALPAPPPSPRPFPPDSGRGPICHPRATAPSTAAAIAKLPRGKAYVFAWPYSKTYLWRRYTPIVARAGLPTSREYKMHCLRKSMASHLEAAGGNATEALRHSKRSVTKAYLDPRIVKPESPVDRLFRPGE